MDENSVSAAVVDCAVSVHRLLGPGLLESVYEEFLAASLTAKGHDVQRQVSLPVVVNGITVAHGFRVDLLVDDAIIVELKSVETIHPLHKKQLLTYLKLSERRLGLLLNFNVVLMKQGICRVVNGL